MMTGFKFDDIVKKAAALDGALVVVIWGNFEKLDEDASFGLLFEAG